MFDTVEKPNLQDELGLAQWVGAAIVLAGLVFLLYTENVRAWSRFTMAAGFVIGIDYCIKKLTARKPTLSLLEVSEKPKTKIRYGPLLWIGFGLMLVACVFIPHIRIFASLMISGFCVLIFDRLKTARS
jgi:drug/metabolite transporter (DMT)-like permease